MKRKLPPFSEIYSKLINISSISSENPIFDQSNKKIIELIAEWLEKIGFTIEIKKIPNTEKKFNLIAKLGATCKGGLVLSGHSDTVNYNEELWKNNPFKLILKENKYIGLGSVDMKGFFACILDMIEEIDFKNIKKPIYILITADEETSMSGAKFFLKSSKIYPDLILIGEPTNLIPIIGHKGHISKSIFIKGQSGHSSNPMGKINSIDLMHKTINHLLKIRKTVENYISQKKYEVPYSTMNFGYIKGGHSTNTICDFCKLYVDIRLLPKFSYEKFKKIFEKELFFIQNKWKKNIFINDLHDPIPSYEVAKKHKKIINIIEKITKKKTAVVNYCSEASFLNIIAPTILLGPGSIKQAHQPNEYLDSSYIKPTKKIIKKIIEHFCF